MMKLINREPAVVAGVVQALLALLIAFGVKLTVEQTGSILALTAALLAVFFVRPRVEPWPVPTKVNPDDEH